MTPVHVKRVDGCVDLLGLHRMQPEVYPHLLESVLKGVSQARFDILFAQPGETIELKPGGSESFLTRLDDAWSASYIDQGPASESTPLPFRGGWFLYLGYELAGEIEPRLVLPAFDLDFPMAFATRFPSAAIVDHEEYCTWLISESSEGLAQLEADVSSLSDEPPVALEQVLVKLVEDDGDDFVEGVERIREYIREGDVFQVNLSRRWRAQLTSGLTHHDLYQSLRQRNPAPFAALVTRGSQAIISSSPERLVESRKGIVQTRPIAGTRPRGADAAKDRSLINELIRHPKERAEHIMLIDLERNDLGRVCDPGSVEVNELMVVETYEHVHHIVSNVRGRLREGTTPGEVIKAVFPGGTITGCPKVRCMEIIAELEDVGRGPYTGSVGYLNLDGDLDLNILIRSIVREGDSALIQAGAGIVADSQADRELEETRSKAKGMIRSLDP